MSETISVKELNEILQKVSRSTGLPTVEAVLDGYDTVKIVLSNEGYYPGLTRNYYVKIDDLTSNFDIELLVEESKNLGKSEK